MIFRNTLLVQRAMLLVPIFLSGCISNNAVSAIEESEFAPITGAQKFDSDYLQALVDSARQESDLIALGAVVADAGGNILALAVSGERLLGSNDPVQPDDAWHIGSNTKMLTALLYARLVESGQAQWGATLSELLPDLADEMDPDWREVSVEELLSHTSGLPPTLYLGGLNFLSFSLFASPYNVGDGYPDDQRTRIAQLALSEPSAGIRGDFRYSSLGYVILGAAIDRIASAQPGAGQGASYETLFREVLLEGMPDSTKNGWGFGAPPEGIEGHLKTYLGLGGYKPVGKDMYADISPLLAPTGTVHVPLASHAIFLSQFLTPDPVHSKLLTPFPDDASNASFGWGIARRDDFGMTYGHTGSNGRWFSSVLMVPDLGIVIIVNTNQAGAAASEMANRFVAEIAKAVAEQREIDLQNND